MAKSLAVEFYYNTVDKTRESYELRIVVTNATEMPSEVFMFQRGTIPPSGEQPKDVFVCIADPVDLEDVPIGAPDLANEMPYYRKSEVTLLFRSIDELQDTKDDISMDLATLVHALNMIPVTTDTITYT